MSDTVNLEAVREEYEKQVFDLRQLLEVSKSLNSTLDYHILIDSILFTIMGQMKVLKAGLFARKGLDSTYFSFHRNYKGFEIDHSIDYSIAEDHPMIKLFNRQYGCYTIEDIRQRLGSLRGIEGLAALEPSLVVPLKAKGVINGILVLADRIDDAEFEIGEREYILNLASLAAIAINNAFLFEMTTTDMMTRLKMKHYFYTVLLERMESAAIGGRPLSVVMIDIDFFKKFNDTYGHTCGDAVLKQVARILQANVRGQDLAARYGGEEFCILLPEADRERGRLIAERIREGVASTPTEYEGKKLTVTISLGVAQYDPARDVSGKSLIDRADRALYRSKQTGRDRVSVAD
ncbi:MAG: sensor domain-containing diguanylate cyclase [Treponema sp.]|nr:sensor domain-containing diguanylate cyclase [Treponema sp.]